MTDEQIIDLIKKDQSEKAFMALYKIFPMVRKMVLSNGGKKEDAEDVFQEGLIILYRKVRASEFKLTSKLSTYMYSVCRFIWSNEAAKQGKLPFTEFDSNMDKDEEDNLNELMMKERKLMLAETIISELGAKCKELLLLFYSETMKLKDIASKMGYSSENTAKSQKFKCLESAKNKLKEAKQLI